MTEAYMVLTNAYEDEKVERVFGDRATAETWAEHYNARYPMDAGWEACEARVEPIPFTPAGETPPEP